jgi:hypothetical protein
MVLIGCTDTPASQDAQGGRAFVESDFHVGAEQESVGGRACFFVCSVVLSWRSFAGQDEAKLIFHRGGKHSIAGTAGL